jgi:hypothetical protein
VQTAWPMEGSASIQVLGPAEALHLLRLDILHRLGVVVVVVVDDDRFDLPGDVNLPTRDGCRVGPVAKPVATLKEDILDERRLLDERRPVGLGLFGRQRDLLRVRREGTQAE